MYDRLPRSFSSARALLLCADECYSLPVAIPLPNPFFVVNFPVVFFGTTGAFFRAAYTRVARRVFLDSFEDRFFATRFGDAP